MTTLFGAIADDFTGATDLAGLIARSGHPVNLRLGVPQGPPTDTAAFEIVALKCRTAPVSEAVAETVAALRWLQGAGATRFYWKYCSTFDSTEKGNIGPVSEALMRALGTEQTIYCPAFPENGRSIFMGNLFVGEQLLSESPMKDHPLTPMRDANLMRLLAPQVTGKVGLANRLTVAAGVDALKARLASLKADGVAHVVADAVANDDLSVIAEACMDMPLMTGGSALAMPSPGLYEKAGLLSRSTAKAEQHEIGPGMIVLSGSCSAMTRKQVARYADKAASFRLDPLALAEAGPGKALDWLSGQAPDHPKLIYATAEPDAVRKAQDVLGVDRAGTVVEEALAALAREAFSRGVRRFVVAGGETSGAVVKAFGIKRLAIGAEIAPGVPWTYGERDGEPLALALKSGNFGDEDFFETAFRRLEEQ